MSHGVNAFLVLSVLCAVLGFSGVAPDVVATAARAGFFGFLTLTLFGGALTRWNGPTVQLPG